MKKAIDYQDLYLKQYKNIPNIWFWGTLILIGVTSTIVALTFFTAASPRTDIGLVVLLGGWAVAVGLSFFARWVSSIAISQKIVVADSLLMIKNNSANQSAPAMEEKLTVETDSCNKDIAESKPAKENPVLSDEDKKKKKKIIYITATLTGVCALYTLLQLIIGIHFPLEVIIDVIMAIGAVASPVVGVLLIKKR